MPMHPARFLFLLTLSVLSIFPVSAQQNDQVVAELLNKLISKQEVSPTDGELNAVAKATGVSKDMATAQFQQARLTEVIIKGVLNDYADKKGIKAPQDMIDRFLEVFGENLNAEQKMPEEVKDDEELSKTFAEKKRDPEEIAREQVRHWLTEKAMYEEFGGPVVFRSTAPQYPVGAYRQLLTQYAEAGKLKIQMPVFAAVFWRGFTPPYNAEIDPKNVDFSTPWWY